MNNFLWALKFLTIIPINNRSGELPKSGYAVCWFPIVGIVIGAILSVVSLLLQNVFPPFITNAFILITYIVITGALHLDGFADTCDGIYGGWNREKRLEIMKDSHIGSYGVIGLMCILGLRYACLLHMGECLFFLNTKDISTGILPSFGEPYSRDASSAAVTKIIVLCLMPAVGRWAQVLAAGVSNYARDISGTGSFIVNGTTRKHVAIASVVPFVLILYLCRLRGLAVCAIIVVFTLFIIWYIKRKIGGMTGDTLGAINEAAEIVFLLALFVIF